MHRSETHLKVPNGGNNKNTANIYICVCYVSIKFIDNVPHESKLLDKEGQWAYRLKSIRPQGLNNNDFFVNQTRSNRKRKR